MRRHDDGVTVAAPDGPAPDAAPTRPATRAACPGERPPAARHGSGERDDDTSPDALLDRLPLIPPGLAEGLMVW